MNEYKLLRNGPLFLLGRGWVEVGWAIPAQQKKKKTANKKSWNWSHGERPGRQVLSRSCVLHRGTRPTG